MILTILVSHIFLHPMFAATLEPISPREDSDTSADEGDSSQEEATGDFFPAVIGLDTAHGWHCENCIQGERAKSVNQDRYLVFFDDGYASYLDHADVRWLEDAIFWNYLEKAFLISLQFELAWRKFQMCIVRPLCQFSTDVWLDVDKKNRDFMKEYVQVDWHLSIIV